MGRVLGLVVGMLLLLRAPAVAAEPGLAVVVHPSRTDVLTRADVARIFLRRRRFWDDGTPIVPLNRESGSAAREAFSTHVLGGESARFSTYWNAQYFHGVFPPTVLSSASAVKRYVAADPGAIGYIETSEVDASVRVVLTLEPSAAQTSP